MKPRIFIGSSYEALDIAAYIKKSFQSDFECYLWTDDIFKYNEGFLETLMKEASLFDFGILVFSKDDYTTSRDKKFEAPRDNVLFEFGLFLGRLGVTRAFIFQENGVKIPSDLLGITLARFERVPDLRDSETLNTELAKMKRTIQEKTRLGVLGLLPSTALAIGYFYNFVSCVCDTLAGSAEIVVKERTYSRYKFRIIIPQSLDADIKKRADYYFRKNKLEQYPLETSRRKYPLFVSMDPQEEDILILNDMPTTLSGIDKAIEMYLKKGHIGKSSEQKLLEERDLRNFTSVLQSLIESDSYCSEFVELITED